MTEKEYRSDPAISRSQLWGLNDSPEKFRYRQKHPPKPTEALIFGQAFHKLVLEPESFFDEFAVAPNVDRRTAIGKLEWKQFLDDNEGHAIIDTDMYDHIREMRDAIMQNKYISQLLSGEHEKPYFWTDEMTGEACKCRVDCITEINGQKYIVDLKTTTNADTDTFIRHAIKYGYHLQAAMYREGVRAVTGMECGFVFIAVEKDPPFAVNILQADDIFIKHGYDVFRELIGIYHDCKITDNWYGYLGKFYNINVLGLPSYLAKEVE